MVALYKSVYPWATPAQIEARLKSTATKGGSSLSVGIVNAAKMLSEKPAAPGFLVLDPGTGEIRMDSDNYSGQPVPCESKLAFFTRNADESWYVLYTLDGKTPSVKNGAAVNGIRASGEIDLTPYAGQTITVKAVQVNGLGMASAVFSKKLTVAASTQITGVTVSGPSELVAGKTGEFTAVVEPADKANQSVTWSISSYSSSMYAAKIDAKTGKLTTPKNMTGWVKVVATSTVSSIKKSDPFEVTVKQMNPVAKMTLDHTSVVLVKGYLTGLHASMVDTYGNPVEHDVKWISSNPKIATVDDSGKVTAVAKGSATITCKALDGSGKSAKCTVKVVQRVETITITGQSSIAPGASATYKAAVLPTTADNKKVTWSLSGAPAGVTISSSGKVTVPAGTATGRSFTVRASSQDGGASTGFVVKVANKCTGVYADCSDTAGVAPGVTKWGRYGGMYDMVTAIELFNVDLPNTIGTENQLSLEAWSVNATTIVSWSSSNPSVVTVDADGNVTAHKAGTAKLTLAAMDGSGKKATVSVKVSVPASSISISSSIPRMDKGVYYLGFGKSAANKAVFVDTYGKPTNQKVKWSYSAYDRYIENSTVKTKNVTAKFSQWISLSNSGKLTLSAKAYDAWLDLECDLVIRVRATSTDGTKVYDEIEYIAVHNSPVMEMITNSVYAERNKTYPVEFYCSQWFAYGNGNNSDFIVTSSNPKVASFSGIEYTGTRYRYCCYIATGNVKGTATITIKTTDGSNKSCSFKVTVR